MVTQAARGRFRELVLGTALGISVASSFGAAADASKRFAAVVCTSEANGPWVRKAEGTLVRTTAPNEVIYTFEGTGQTFEWRLMTSPQGNTTAIPPGFLIDRFITSKIDPAPESRRQAIDATGEIRETAASSALALLMARDCRRAGPKLRPNSTAESDARKSSARGSP